MSDKAVVVRVGMYSNSNVDETFDTGFSPEEWAEVEEDEQQNIITDLVWERLDVWTEEREA